MILDKKTTSYLVREIDRKTWKLSRGRALTNGFDTANKCLLHLIKDYANG